MFVERNPKEKPTAMAVARIEGLSEFERNRLKFFC